MEKLLGSIADLTRLPAALFIIDTVKEHIAVSEARKLSIPTIAICDTNTDPTEIDFPIPANDDATKSITLIVNAMVKAIEEGLAERKLDKENEREKEVAAEEEAGEGREFAAVDADEEGESTEGGEGAKKKTATRPRKTAAKKK